jgi:hypothetical protein
MRFITLGYINRKGRVDEMIKESFKALDELTSGKRNDGIQTPCSQSDYFFLVMLIELTKRYNQTVLHPTVQVNETGMFELPLNLMAIEKDFANFSQWHIRSDLHATKCMTKIIKAALVE